MTRARLGAGLGAGGAAAIVASIVVAACGSSGSSSSAPAATVPGLTVVMKNIAYNPSRLSVRVGDKVTFVWQDDSIPHNVDGASDLPAFTSGSPRTTGSWTFTFSKAGTYAFHCDVHPSMTGTVTVT